MWHRGSNLWWWWWWGEGGFQDPLGSWRCSFAFHAFFSAMFPVRQEVSSASCHRPLSCGHFPMFCQCLRVLLTQRMEVVLRQRPENSFDDLWLRELTLAGATMPLDHILRLNITTSTRPLAAHVCCFDFEGKIFCSFFQRFTPSSPSLFASLSGITKNILLLFLLFYFS